MELHSLQKGDIVAIVSLSSGILGEQFIAHEISIGVDRLKKMGLVPIFMPNSLKGIEYLKEHPEDRASDLKQAFMDDNVKMIIAAIGGNDTYLTIPYLMEDNDFRNKVKNSHKIFTGYSDTTVNHIMFNRLGLSTIYGPSFLADVCELDDEMLPYTEKYFSMFFDVLDEFEIESSPTWYLDRNDYSEKSIGISREEKQELYGYELLNGSGIISGKLFGGCVESFFDLVTIGCNVVDKYSLIPSIDELSNMILFLETSEEKPTPKQLETMLNVLESRKILSSVKGVLIGKPYDEIYYDEYKTVYKKIFSNLNIPVLYNINFGHSYPRCIIPYDADATIDFENKRIFIKSKVFSKRNT